MRLRHAACALALSLVGVTLDAQRLVFRFPVAKPGAAAGGVTCAALGVTCVFETSFTTAQGWTSNRTGNPCGTGGELNGIQTGIAQGLDGAIGGNCPEVTTTANYSNGAGGRGYSMYIGDGVNVKSGQIFITIPTTPTHYWFRYYFRYETNLAVTGNTSPHKALYHDGTGCGHAGGCYIGWGTTQVRVTNAGNNFLGSGGGWTTFMGGATSDGAWHCGEYEFDKGDGATTGIGRAWIDGVQYLNRTDVDYDTTTGFSGFSLPSNGDWTVSGTGIGRADFDDLAISVVSRIGGPGC